MSDKLEKLLVEIKTEQKRQGDLLNQHTAILHEHSVTLKEHSDTLKQHGDLLKSHDSHLKSQGDLLIQLIGIVKNTNEKVTDMKHDIVSLKHGQEQHEKLLQNLIEGQERQDKILESLALRSLEQETEIRELKRVK